LRQAHARLEQYEEELTGPEEAYPPLRAVTDVDERRFRRHSAGVSERPARRPLIELDDDLLDARPTGRGGPRRPTGAAADYARAATGDRPRRTVRINGHGAQSAIRPTPSELRGPRPDRIAGWAVGFAIFLALLAALVGG
jgi:hypothetical protein